MLKCLEMKNIEEFHDIRKPFCSIVLTFILESLEMAISVTREIVDHYIILENIYELPYHKDMNPKQAADPIQNCFKTETENISVSWGTFKIRALVKHQLTVGRAKELLTTGMNPMSMFPDPITVVEK